MRNRSLVVASLVVATSAIAIAGSRAEVFYRGTGHVFQAPPSTGGAVLPPGGGTQTEIVLDTVVSGLAYGDPWILTFTASGGTAPYSYLLETPLPSGITASVVGDDFVVRGPGLDADYGSFTVSASQGGHTGRRTFGPVVVPAPATAFAIAPSASSVSYAHGQSWSLSFAASGGRGPYTFLTPTNVPNGIAATPAGSVLTLSGTVAAGTYAGIVATARDAAGRTLTSSPATVVVAAPTPASMSANRTTLSGLDVAAPVTVSTAKTIVVTNSGQTAGSAVATTSAPFSVSGDCGTSLAPGASCTVSVTASATADGALSGQVSIAGIASPVTLTGTASGFAPVMSVPTSLAVAVIAGGSTPGACTDLKVSNTGGTSGLAGASIAFSGAEAATFETCTPSASACSASTIAAGSFCNLGIRNKAAANAASQTATATVSASGVTAKTVALSSSAAGFLQACAFVSGGLCADGTYHLGGNVMTGSATNSNGKAINFSGHFYMAPDTNETLSFAGAVASCNALIANGYDDWMLLTNEYVLPINKPSSPLNLSFSTNTNYWTDSPKSGANFGTVYLETSRAYYSAGAFAAGTSLKKFRCIRVVGTYTVAP